MSYYESQRDERIAYALESIAKELGILNKQISVVAKEPSADVVEKVEVDKAALVAVQIAMEEIGRYKKYVGDDPVFYYTSKETTALANYALELLDAEFRFEHTCPNCGAKMDGGKAE